MVKKLLVLVLVLGLAGTVMADLRGHWELNGNGLDSSGYGNNGTALNTPTPTTDRFGNPNSAMAFDGVVWAPDAFNCGNNASIQISGEMTITAWVLLDSTSVTNGRILSKLAVPGGVDWSYSMNIENSSGGVSKPATLQIGKPANAGLITLSDDVPLTQNVWVHFASVYRPGVSMEIYLDGKLAAIRTTSVPESQYSSGPGYLCIGSFQGVADCGWKGKLDDICLYSDALSAAEIAEIGYYEFPSPADNAGNVPLNTNLSWKIPMDANEVSWTYKVYFGTNSTLAVTPINAGPLSAGQNRVTVTNAQLGGTLAINTYYWRVDSVDPNTSGTPVTYTGDVWSFAAGAGLPTLISPADTYDPAVEIDVNLAWSSDPLIVTNNIIITPDGGTPVTVVNKTSPFNPYTYGLTDNPDLLTMEWNKNYEWKVVGLDSSGNTLAIGPNWKFKVRALNCVGMDSDIDGSSDCIVNLADFAMLASEWLDCNWDDGGKASPCP
jgi:hypothetical protein